MGMPRVVHDLPEDDWVAHEASERCVCGPCRRPAGPDAFVIVHARLDGRDDSGPRATT